MEIQAGIPKSLYLACKSTPGLLVLSFLKAVVKLYPLATFCWVNKDEKYIVKQIFLAY